MLLNNLLETNATCAETRLMHIYATDPAGVVFCISPGIIAFLYPFIESGTSRGGFKRPLKDVKTRNNEKADVKMD